MSIRLLAIGLLIGLNGCTFGRYDHLQHWTAADQAKADAKWAAGWEERRAYSCSELHFRRQELHDIELKQVGMAKLQRERCAREAARHALGSPEPTVVLSPKDRLQEQLRWIQQDLDVSRAVHGY